jgi:DNA-binding MurR/RpiR family transcriptional regulator
LSNLAYLLLPIKPSAQKNFCSILFCGRNFILYRSRTGKVEDPRLPQVNAPTSFDDLKQLITSRYGELSGRLQQIAEFALEHPNDMALGTVAAVATRAGVQPSAIVRFANSLGYDGFSDLQQVFRSRLVASSPSYRERIDTMRSKAERARKATGTDSVLAQFTDDGVAALQHLRETIRPTDLTRAVSVLARASEVYLLGQGRAFPVAYYLYYAIARLEMRAHLLDGIGGLLHEEARAAARDDALIAVSFKEYSRDVAAIVEEAAARGVKIIALTDSPLSPIARHATVTFEVDQSPALPFRSLVAPMCLAQSLVVALGHQLASRGGQS